MSNRRFLDLVRQYALLAKARRTSYAEQVHQLAALRAETLITEVPDEGKRAQKLQDLHAFLSNEYQKWDEGFALRAYD